MLNFNNLSKLNKHISFLSKKIKSEDIFLVGWCIRDLLLDIENDPTDIDITMSWTPEAIYKQTNKTWLSHFITEKFGTMTFITKPKTWNPINYELTPLRTEWDYLDFRHPGEIHRSNNLLLDSNRRDFTINSVYYTTQTIWKDTIINKKVQTKNHDFLKLLDKHWFVFFQDLNLYVIQNHKYISKLFKDGEFQEEFLSYLQNITKENIIQSDLESEIKNSKSNNIGFVIDPHKGIQDMINKKIKTVGEANKRFGEDALRIIRWLRFVNVLNVKLKNIYNKKNETSTSFFDFDKATWVSIKENHKLVEEVAKERIKDEMIKVFQSDNPFGFIALLDEAKLVEFLFPSLYLTKFIEQPVRYHPFDIYTHTMLALFEIQKMNTDYLVKLGVLYHDVGKVWQFDSYKEGLSPEEIREILAWPLNHRNSWPELTKIDFKKLWFSKKEIDTIARYVEHHHKPEEMLYAKEENREKKARKFLSQAGYEKAQNILDICIADRMGQYNPLQNSHDTWDVYELKWLLEKLHTQEGQFTIKELAIKGNDIIKTHKLKPWPQIGKILNKTLDRVMEDISRRNNKKSINAYIKKIL